jgi:soluble lytic murein transglycosylase-like protein
MHPMKTKYIKQAFWPLSLIAIILLSFNIPSPVTDDEYREAFSSNNKVFAVNIPDQMNFAGEAVPLDRFYVKEALEYEMTVNTYWQSSTLLLLKRAHRWFPLIEPILKKNGVPDDFKYLAVAESGLKNIVSPVGATGFWQIMKSTAREYGLEVNSSIDERYHVEKATEVACQYLLKAHEKFGNWTLAAASYNTGMNKINKEIDRQQEDSYYNMNFVEETNRYVYRILALKEIIRKPKDFGFHLRDEDFYQAYDTYEVTVDSTIASLAQFANKYGLNYRELKIYNPWLRQSSLPDKSRRVYHIKLPK